MKRIALSLVLLATMIATAACGGAKAAENKPAETKPTAPVQKTYKTDLGDLTLPATPKRIVAINLQAIDSLVALGVKPVGYAEPGGEPVNYLGNALDGIPKVGSHSKPSLESIAALQPDLIIIDGAQKDLVPELKKMAPVLSIRSTSYQDTMAQLKLIGEIVEKKAEAEKFAADFEAKIKASVAKAGGKQAPKAAAIFGSEQKPGLWMKQSFVGSILTALGAQHGYNGPSEADYPDLAYISLEKILESNPQVLLLMSTPGKELSKAWAANPAFKGTDAVKQNRVHEVDRQSWSRSRGPIAATKIVEQAFPLLYPDAK